MNKININVIIKCYDELNYDRSHEHQLEITIEPIFL